MYDGRKIANFMLSEFDPNEFEITNLKLNKVLYYVQAFQLVRFSRPLIKNHFEAWDHGPIVRVVYHEFKSFDRSPITTLARHLNYASGEQEVIAHQDIPAMLQKFIGDVASHYMKFSASQLRQMTHKVGGPWYQVYHSAPDQRGIRDRIPNELISQHFSEEIGSKALN
jgi:uncharacterized phage-associated protein